MIRSKPVKLGYKLFEPECGSDDKLSPLIFLHGIASSKEATWGDLPQDFADQTKRKAYSVDARNHGDSDWSDEFDFDLNAEDLFHFLDEKNLSKVVIIAHSIGGYTGIKVALKSERVEMLFVEEMFVKKIPQSFMDRGLSSVRLWLEAEKFIPVGVDQKTAENFITDYVLQKRMPDEQLSDKSLLREDFYYPLGKDSSGRYVFKINYEVLSKKVRDAEAMMTENQGTYEGPSFFIYATKSPYQIENEKQHILKHFPKAEFVSFETSKHYIHKAFPDLFVETVVKFIKQTETNL